MSQIVELIVVILVFFATILLTYFISKIFRRWYAFLTKKRNLNGRVNTSPVFIYLSEKFCLPLVEMLLPEFLKIKWKPLGKTTSNTKRWVIIVSLIVCTSECLYQLDGYCSLERAVSGGVPCEENPCVNFVPKRTVLQNSSQRFTDISDPDQL